MPGSSAKKKQKQQQTVGLMGRHSNSGFIKEPQSWTLLASLCDTTQTKERKKESTTTRNQLEILAHLPTSQMILFKCRKVRQEAEKCKPEFQAWRLGLDPNRLRMSQIFIRKTETPLCAYSMLLECVLSFLNGKASQLAERFWAEEAEMQVAFKLNILSTPWCFQTSAGVVYHNCIKKNPALC